MQNLLNHGYLFSAITLAIYSQCIMRWRLQFHGDFPSVFQEKVKFLVIFLLDFWVVSALVATFFAGIFWIISLTKFELNYAYPWMALIFVLMMFVGALFFGETITKLKLIGTFFVFCGLIMVARG